MGMWTLAIAGLMAASPAFAQDSGETQGSEEIVACGCGWRKHKACSISAEQLLQSITHSRVLDMCKGIDENAEKKDWDSEGGHAWRTRFECSIRKQIKEKADNLKPCLEKTTREECYAESMHRGCEWEAQGAMECGIRESSLISDVIDPRDGTFISEEAMSHPLLQLIQRHDYCASHDQQSCPRGMCRWRGFECDVSPSSFFYQLIHRPALLNVLQLATPAAQCRARYEHGDGKCDAGCVEHDDMCRLDVRSVRHLHFHASGNNSEDVLKGMTDVICRFTGYYEYERNNQVIRNCRHPCQATDGNWNGNASTVCKAPPSLDNIYGLDRNLSMTQLDFEVLEVFMIVRSATLMYERHCEQFSDKYETCKKASTVCDEGFEPDYEHTTMAPGDIGLKGFLGDVVKALDDGTFVDFFHDHVSGELDDAEKELLKEKSEELLEEWLKRPEKEDFGKDGTGKNPFDILFPDKETKTEDKEKFPWLIAVGAMMFAAVCGGLALGVLCSTTASSPGGRPHRIGGDQERGVASRRSPDDGFEAE